MTNLEILEQRSKIDAETAEILGKIKAEKRALTEAENKRIEELKADSAKLDAEVEKNAEEQRSISATPQVKVGKNYAEDKPESLISIIRSMKSNRYSDAQLAINEKGCDAMTRSSVEASGFAVPTSMFMRALDGIGTASHNYTASTYNGGKETVATDIAAMTDPLYNELVLAQAGATFMTGLKGNLQLPKYSGASAAWAAENGAASNGTGTFDKVELAPNRLCTYVDISNQLLIQDSASANEVIRRDIVTSLAEKLESTILGSGAASNSPAGLANGLAAATQLTWANILKAETDAIAAKINGNNKKWVLSPGAWSAMKSTALGGSNTDFRMILDDANRVNGREALVTGNASTITISSASKNLAFFGDWSHLIIGQWGAIDLCIDGISQFGNGFTRIGVAAYYDAKLRNANAVKAYAF